MELAYCLSFLIASITAPLAANRLPADVAAALSAPDSAVLYSLEPDSPSEASREQLYRFQVLGKTKLSRERTTIATHAFEQAILDWDGSIGACFNPRQALRITKGTETYDLLLCYECHQLYVYRGDKEIGELGAAGSAKVLNGLLTEAHIPLAFTESEEDMAKRRRESEQASQRWFDAMPKPLQPLWAKATRNELAVEIKPLRKALNGGLPNAHERILALYRWYGSGAGRWSGYPVYESAAETLLLDFPTADLITAAQDHSLDETQTEGAARLFGGWAFSQHRPDDLKLVPLALKKRLLDHSRKTKDEDKRGRAEYAFGTP